MLNVARLVTKSDLLLGAKHKQLLIYRCDDTWMEVDERGVGDDVVSACVRLSLMLCGRSLILAAALAHCRCVQRHGVAGLEHARRWPIINLRLY
jgi:hypothetical protein